jgi:TorA maturation chaperone TorD
MQGNISSSIDDLKAELAVFTVLAAFYNNNPNEELLKAVNELDSSAINEVELKAAISLIKNGAGSEAENILELKRDWTKLFRGLSPDYGARPPYEQLFSGGDVTEVVGALAAAYADYGFKPQAERHDYIGTEFSFLACVAAFATEAYEKGDNSAFNAHAKAFKNFLEIHPKQWFAKFKEHAFPIASTDFYRGVLEFTEFVLRSSD